MVYVHGGGWVCVNREVLMQSVTPFARAGFVVYSIDYPLAPENKPVNAIVVTVQGMRPLALLSPPPTPTHMDSLTWIH